VTDITREGPGDDAATEETVDLVRSPEKRGRLSWIVTVYALTVSLHWATPVGPHAWHWVHLVAQKLLFVPVLMAAAWFGASEVILAAVLVSAAFLMHIARDWAGYPMLQADQLAELVNIWVTAPAVWLFFRNDRRSAINLGKAHADTLFAMISSLEMRERYTAGHSRRVSGYSVLIAKQMGIADRETLRTLSTGALLHDLGKIGVPDAVLLKTGDLDAAEWALMRAHPERGAALVAGVDSLAGAVPIIKGHHERCDGSGYPAGLSGDAIPLGARIVAVADIYDALTTERPYKRALTHAETLSFLADQGGETLDRNVVEAFSRLDFSELRRLAGRRGIVLKEG
jgi:HD-GYP domain-containing protein (c-di-GMP phosphodiesterase class II)